MTQIRRSVALHEGFLGTISNLNNNFDATSKKPYYI